MRKKRLFMLPCMAAVAVATAFGTKSLQTNASNSLLMENVEAISMGEFTELEDCYDMGWGPDPATWQYRCPDGTTDKRIDDCPSQQDFFTKGLEGKCKKQ